MLTPLPREKWNSETTAHLLNRAGFGATPEEIESASEKGLNVSVKELIEIPGETANLPAPEWAHPRNVREIRMGLRASKEDPAQRQEKLREIRMTEGRDVLDLRRWWLDRMLNGPAPLL